MKKQHVALSAAILMTICVGLGILAVGGTAFFNKNGVAISSTTSSSGGGVAAQPIAENAQLQQLQSLVDQYKSREQEYQTREQQYQQQLSTINAQVQQDENQLAQFQMLINALQQKGVITISGDGRIFINH